MYIQVHTKSAAQKKRRNTDKISVSSTFLKRCEPDLNRRMTVLQTGALPLGYRTIFCFNDSNGNRTRVTAVKGRCLNRLTMEPRSSCLFRLGASRLTPSLDAFARMLADGT